MHFQSGGAWLLSPSYFLRHFHKRSLSLLTDTWQDAEPRNGISVFVTNNSTHLFATKGKLSRTSETYHDYDSTTFKNLIWPTTKFFHLAEKNHGGGLWPCRRCHSSLVGQQLHTRIVRYCWSKLLTSRHHCTVSPKADAMIFLPYFKIAFNFAKTF